MKLWYILDLMKHRILKLSAYSTIIFNDILYLQQITSFLTNRLSFLPYMLSFFEEELEQGARFLGIVASLRFKTTAPFGVEFFETGFTVATHSWVPQVKPRALQQIF